jgi:hypothetical protein
MLHLQKAHSKQRVKNPKTDGTHRERTILKRRRPEGLRKEEKDLKVQERGGEI